MILILLVSKQNVINKIVTFHMKTFINTKQEIKNYLKYENLI